MTGRGQQRRGARRRHERTASSPIAAARARRGAPGTRASWSLLAVALVAGACAAPPVEALPAVPYDPRHAADTMDVFLPRDGATGRPAVMFIHGGSWRSGSSADHTPHALRLAQAGYVTASINYRLVPAAAYPAQEQDALCALAFLRGQADAWGLDPARVAVVGYSAGGHLASLLGVAAAEPAFQPDCAAGPTAPPRAVVSGAGPEDLRGFAGVAAVEQMVGGTLAALPERWDLLSPRAHVRAGAPPFLFVHGRDDAIVPIGQSRAMRDALVGVGVDARLLELAGDGHVAGTGAAAGREELVVLSLDGPEAWLALADFLADTVGAP